MDKSTRAAFFDKMSKGLDELDYVYIIQAKHDTDTAAKDRKDIGQNIADCECVLITAPSLSHDS